MVGSQIREDVYVVNSLVDMYAKCGSMEDAWRVFNKMPSQNMVTWTAVIVGHVKCGEGQKALELFQQMQHELVAMQVWWMKAFAVMLQWSLTT